MNEIMLFEHTKLVKIAKYMEDNNDKEYYATGDPKQLQAIGDVIDNKYKVKLLMNDILFPNALSLNENMRIQKSDSIKLKEILDDVENDKYNVKDIIQKHFKNKKITLDQFKNSNINKGIAYYNSSADLLNKYIQCKKLNIDLSTKDIIYNINDTIICKKQLCLNNQKLHINYEYRIIKINKTIFILQDIYTKENVFKIDVDIIQKHFSLPYCSTVHSSQGNSIDEPYIIADTTSNHVDKNWLISAITRCTKVENIFILTTSLKQAYIERDIQDLIHNYRLQDINRSVDENNYVNVKWIKDNFKKCKGICKYCGINMTFEKNTNNKITVNRLCNKLGHVIGNIELCCWKCNNIIR